MDKKSGNACENLLSGKTVNFKFRICSTKMARNEQACAHQMSYRKLILQNIFGAVMHVVDCSCAGFSAESDGATADRQIPNRTFSSLL